MNFQTMNNQRKLMLISAVVGIISVFLPWFSAGAFGFSVNINGFHGWGILAFLAFAIAAAIAIMGAQAEALDKNMWLAAIACGALALLAIIITIISSHNSGFGIVSAGLGFGIWIALAGAVGITVFTWKYKRPEHDLKSSFESLKKSVAVSAASAKVDTTASVQTNKITELERLSKLKENGSITDEEYQQLKSKFL